MFIFLFLYNMQQINRNRKKKKKKEPLLQRLREQRNMLNNSEAAVGKMQALANSKRLKIQLNKNISREKREKDGVLYRDSL